MRDSFRSMGVKLWSMSGYLTKLLDTILVFSGSLTLFPLQNAGSKTTQESVVITKLFPPVYPPLAKQTRISGDVELILEVRADGRLESATVVSGHPLLKQAALDSAEGSQFDCRICTQGVRSFQMLYSFQLGPTSYCAEASKTSSRDQKEEHYPRVVQTQNHVTVIDQPVGTCDLAFTITRTRVRSAKCLYLWKCGSHVEEQ
jgi:TonB family protein